MIGVKINGGCSVVGWPSFNGRIIFPFLLNPKIRSDIIINNFS